MKAYACGTPIRQKIVKAVATSLNCEYIPEAEPTYKGGDAVIWGLIRGAPKLIEQVRKAGHTYWHMDNGYFGRNVLFRITRNANQRTDLLERPSKRWEEIAKLFHITISPWQKGGGKIIVAQSTPHLYKFMGTDINTWTNSVVATLKKNTDREIVVRPKPGKKGSVPIETDLQNCHALVTHTSASALDALRMGVPVFTTGECCAKPLALQDLTKIEEPIYPEREPLFWHLSYCMFSRDELERGDWKIWSGFS